MKKIASTLLAILITIGAGYSQGVGINAMVHQDVPESPFTLKGKLQGRLNDIHVTAMRHFRKAFAHAEDVIWTINDEAISVFFSENSIKMRSTYNKKGYWLYTILYYDELRLPGDIRHLVKSSYYDLSIVLVTEMRRQTSTAYYIKMEDGKMFLTVMVKDGEIREVEKLTKI